MNATLITNIILINMAIGTAIYVYVRMLQSRIIQWQSYADSLERELARLNRVNNDTLNPIQTVKQLSLFDKPQTDTVSIPTMEDLRNEDQNNKAKIAKRLRITIEQLNSDLNAGMSLSEIDQHYTAINKKSDQKKAQESKKQKSQKNQNDTNKKKSSNGNTQHSIGNDLKFSDLMSMMEIDLSDDKAKKARGYFDKWESNGKRDNAEYQKRLIGILK